MLYSASLSLLLGLCSVSAGPLQEPAPFQVPDTGAVIGQVSLAAPRCGTLPNVTEVLAMEENFRSLLPANQTQGQDSAESTAGTSATKTINVYFHVIINSATGEGDMPDSQIKSQLDVLNKAFKGSGFQWLLASTSRVTNTDWFNNAGPDSAQQTAMKTKLRQGGVKDLNLYTVGFNNPNSKGLLGYATFPSYYKEKPQDDGVVLSYKTLPGGKISQYNGGMTAVHEIGHWSGLYHTFQGGCDGQGDQVDDTPPEKTGASGCPSSRKTCPASLSKSTDPIHNYMDYSDDACMTEFTKGQIARIKDQLRLYRGC
ncbi:Metalloprotease [Roridomyces roridus]|uniref:Metalloprotease n=1 Tax=Roridomyces roridus TaxID=1738132 RepID=A0AAD7FNV1_9AGAR|nr:Metalloprotease [Roridomyces roridus]